MAYKIIDEGNNFYTVQGVPIFQMHTDRGFPCDSDWMSSAVQNHAMLKASGYRPTIVIGHNRKGGIEKESVGFLDNLVVKGKLLYADLVRIPKAIKEKIIQNAYPNRSVEVLPKSKRILCMALLGGTTPHFALPQVVFENNEESEWHPYNRSNEMLDDEMKKEIYELVGAAVAEAVPETLVKFLGDDGDEGDTEFFVDEETGEEYAVPAALAKLLAKGATTVGRKTAGAATKIGRKLGLAGARKATTRTGQAAMKSGIALSQAGRAMRGQQLATGAGVIGGAAGIAAGTAAASRRKQQGYAIDENTGEVLFDGEPLGVIVTYDQMAEAGMEVPTVPKHPEELPSVEEAKPALKINEADVGVGSAKDGTLVTPVSEPGGAALIDLLAREDSDQFVMNALEAQNYDLNQRLSTVETANALVTAGRRAEEYEKWLTDQKAAGTPIGDVAKTVDYMMSQEPDAVEEFKKLILSQPKVAFGKIEDVKHFELQDEVKVKADYEANKDTYQALGVNAKDLAYAKYIRTNHAVGEVAAVI